MPVGVFVSISGLKSATRAASMSGHDVRPWSVTRMSALDRMSKAAYMLAILTRLAA